VAHYCPLIKSEAKGGAVLDGTNVRNNHDEDLEEGEPSASLHAALFTAYLCQLDAALAR
jgi:hypothetical protein